MGCANSKTTNRKTLNRLSQYHLAALQESQGLVKSPIPLEDADESFNPAGEAKISLRSFHNLFYDGFYAPYVRNPDYLLIIDMRSDEQQYKSERILFSKWHGNVSELESTVDAKEVDLLTKYCHIVLYDVDGSSIHKPDSELRQVYQRLRDRKLDPMCLVGGLKAVRERCPYLLSRVRTPRLSFENGLNNLSSWFPSIILDGQLFLGRCDQANNPEILSNLGVSHVVCTSLEGITGSNLKSDQTKMLLLAPPKDDSTNCKKSSKTSKSPQCLSKGSTDTLDDPSVSTTALTDEMTKLTDFVRDAFENGGRVLVHGELGVDRSAALVMALLMHQRSCSLEDAFYYVKRCKPTVQPSDVLLKALAKFEAEIFGKRLTKVEDLCY